MSDREPVDLHAISHLLRQLKVTTEQVKAAINERSRGRAVKAAFAGTLTQPVRPRRSRKPDDLFAGFSAANLPLIADREIEAAFRNPDPKAENPDPLGLGSNWATREMSLPIVVDNGHGGTQEVSPEWLSDYTKWIREQGRERRYGVNCTPIPTFYLARRITIRDMTYWWSWSHDGIVLDPKLQIRRLQSSNWMLVTDYQEIAQLAIQVGVWKLNYWPSPELFKRMSWDDQKKATSDRGLVNNRAQDAFWFTNLAFANGIAEPDGSHSLVDTYDPLNRGCPLGVGVWSGGVYLYRCWFPQGAYSHIRAAVSGVDMNFET